MKYANISWYIYASFQISFKYNICNLYTFIKTYVLIIYIHKHNCKICILNAKLRTIVSRNFLNFYTIQNNSNSFINLNYSTFMFRSAISYY